MRKARSSWSGEMQTIILMALFVVLLLLIQGCAPRERSQGDVPALQAPGGPVSARAPTAGGRLGAPTDAATPSPADFDTVCKTDAVVVLEGFLSLPQPPTCRPSTLPEACVVALRDPLSARYLPVVMPLEPGMEAMSYPNTEALWPPLELFRFVDSAFLQDGDMLAVSGMSRRIVPADDHSTACEFVPDFVWILEEFTLVDWDLPVATLEEALAGGWIKLAVAGDGLERITLEISPEVDFQFELEILPGTIFQSASSDVQNMVVRTGSRIHIRPNVRVEPSVEVSCANMEKRQPTSTDAFTVSEGEVPEDLLRLLQLPEFAKASFRIQQFAVWTITDNPAPDEYVSLTIAPGVAQAPNPDELEFIESLFIRAGIEASRYAALGG